jgi:hypothetical protein
VFVLVFSSATNHSQQVERELDRAVSSRLPIIPFRVEDVLPRESIEYYLAGQHWLDALTSPLDDHLARLSGAITTLMQRSAPPVAVAPQPAATEPAVPEVGLYAATTVEPTVEPAQAAQAAPPAAVPEPEELELAQFGPESEPEFLQEEHATGSETPTLEAETGVEEALEAEAEAEVELEAEVEPEVEVAPEAGPGPEVTAEPEPEGEAGPEIEVPVEAEPEVVAAEAQPESELATAVEEAEVEPEPPVVIQEAEAEALPEAEAQPDLTTLEVLASAAGPQAATTYEPPVGTEPEATLAARATPEPTVVAASETGVATGECPTPAAATVLVPEQVPEPPARDAAALAGVPSPGERSLEAAPAGRALHKPTLIAAAAVGIAWVVILVILDQLI